MRSQNKNPTANNENLNEQQIEANDKYDTGIFRFFNINKGFIPQHLYDRLQKNKIDLSTIKPNDEYRGEHGEEIFIYNPKKKC